VLIQRLAGARERRGAVRSAGRAINLGAVRNMMQNGMKQKEDGERKRSGCER
jgi:hypothetical protein